MSSINSTLPADAMIKILNARINLLRQRDPVVNANIIRKLERKIRQLREFNNESS